MYSGNSLGGNVYTKNAVNGIFQYKIRANEILFSERARTWLICFSAYLGIFIFTFIAAHQTLYRAASFYHAEHLFGEKNNTNTHTHDLKHHEN